MNAIKFPWRIYLWIIFVILMIQLVGVVLSYTVSQEILHSIRKVQFIVSFELFMFTGSVLIWYRCVNVLISLRNYGRSLVEDSFRAVLIFFLALVHFSWLTFHILSSTEPHSLAIFSFVCFGLYIHLIVLFVFFTVLEFIGEKVLCGHCFFVKRNLHTYLTILLSLILTCFCLWITRLPPYVKHQSITLSNLPRRLDGLSITLVADLHVGPTVGRTRLQTAVNIVNELQSGKIC